MSQNLSSAAVVIGALRSKLAICNIGKIKCTENITCAGSLNTLHVYIKVYMEKLCKLP